MASQQKKMYVQSGTNVSQLYNGPVKINYTVSGTAYYTIYKTGQIRTNGEVYVVTTSWNSNRVPVSVEVYEELDQTFDAS